MDSNTTHALEDYLETIYLLVKEKQFARVKDIAQARDVRPGSVSPALKRLQNMGFINYTPGEYITLTSRGEKEATKTFSKHHLLKRFFKEILLMDDNEAEKNACSLEHYLTDNAMERFTSFFEFIQNCPKGQSDFIERFHNCPISNPGEKECDNKCPNKLKNNERTSKERLNMLKPDEGATI
jgi:DtxR family Mn-dependent transcriptional regulator